MKIKHIIPLIAFALFSVLYISCQKEKPDANPVVAEMGYVTGKVLAQNGTTPIPNANIFIDYDNEIYLAKSSRNGTFVLNAPVGQHLLNVQSGTGTIFRGQYPVTITKDQTTTFPDGTLKLLQAANLAYIHGLYDNIQVIITDSLGYTADEITVADLSNLTLLQTYGALFLNCGKSGLMDTQKYANLLTFVQTGGCIYASDWAVEYLTGDGNLKSTGHNHKPSGLKANCPVGLPGGFIEDSTLCTDKSGPNTLLTNCEIVATDLQTYLGKTTIDIEYDLGGWEVIQLLDVPWEVIIRDNNLYGPLAVRTYINNIYKDFDAVQDTGWVTICHFPPGNLNNPQTITISSNALQAHLAHGDYIGPCNNQGASGVIYYTTFHNEVQSGISNDIQQILQYFILNM